MSKGMTKENYEESIKNLGKGKIITNTPAGAYLNGISWGPQINMPDNEFLWFDFAGKLQNKKVICIEALYTGKAQTAILGDYMGPEAEIKVFDDQMLTPVKILTNPNQIKR